MGSARHQRCPQCRGGARHDAGPDRTDAGQQHDPDFRTTAMKRVDLSNFNLNLLLALDGLLSQRSVTAAAKRVRVTPSAMSHSLSELRDLLGDPLLVRSGRGMVLTPRAETLVGPLHTLLGDIERLLHGGAAFDPATTERRFVIAATDLLMTLLLPLLLEVIAREAPGITLEFVPTARRGNAWLLETGDLD